jgi:hypothetical protein
MYVRCIAKAFNNNGLGRRGDLKAVIKVVLLDPGARGAPAHAETTRGWLRPPMSVFNFYRPGYIPPTSGLAASGITAPEFRINNETTMVAWADFAQSFIE